MTKEIKKIGSNINLKGLVIHKVSKTADILNAHLKYAEKELKVTDRERKFIGTIFRSYFDNSRPTYGIFADEDPRFKNELENYLSKDNFLAFSKKAAHIYKNVINTSIKATGGFLIFAHFENTDKASDYMLVLTISNKNGFMVNEDDLTINDIKNLDLSKIDVACMINLTKWKMIATGEDEDINTYLSFARGNKEISLYFLSFIDCDNKTTKTESTKRLMKAFDEYCSEKGYSKEVKTKKRTDIYSYCTAKLEQQEEVLLSAISAILDPEDIDSFASFAADEKRGVSSVINVDKKTIKGMKFISYKDKTMTLEFDSSLLSSDKVIYDRLNRHLTFVDIPQALIDQIP